MNKRLKQFTKTIDRKIYKEKLKFSDFQIQSHLRELLLLNSLSKQYKSITFHDGFNQITLKIGERINNA